MRDCMTCGNKLERGDRVICSACVLIIEEASPGVTCDNCGREFQSDETDYETLLDSCPYCGRRKA